MLQVEFDVDTEGLEELASAAFVARSMAAVTTLMLVAENKIKRLLNQHGSGRWYRSKGGKGKHQASAPGEPPAPDLGIYKGSWHTEVQFEGGIIYGKLLTPLWAGENGFGRRLELGGYGGGAYIAPRPHVRPAWEGIESQIEAALAGINDSLPTVDGVPDFQSSRLFGFDSLFGTGE